MVDGGCEEGLVVRFPGKCVELKVIAGDRGVVVGLVFPWRRRRWFWICSGGGG